MSTPDNKPLEQRLREEAEASRPRFCEQLQAQIGREIRSAQTIDDLPTPRKAGWRWLAAAALIAFCVALYAISTTQEVQPQRSLVGPTPPRPAPELPPAVRLEAPLAFAGLSLSTSSPAQACRAALNLLAARLQERACDQVPLARMFLAAQSEAPKAVAPEPAFSNLPAQIAGLMPQAPRLSLTLALRGPFLDVSLSTNGPSLFQE